MADESKAVQMNNLLSDLFKDYEADYNTFRDSTEKQLVRENLLNSKGITLAIHTLDSVKNTMNPVSHAVSDRHVTTSRKGLGDRIGGFGNQVLLYPNNYVNKPAEDASELTNFLNRFQQSIFSFNDKWQGKYEEILKAHKKDEGLKIRLQNIVFNIFNWRL